MYVARKERISMDVLCQWLSTEPRPLTYILSKLDGTSKVWPWCFKGVIVTILLMKKANKTIRSQYPIVQMPHQIRAILETMGNLWMSGRHYLSSIPFS